MTETSSFIASDGPQVSVVQHQDSVPPGLLGDSLAGLPVQIVRPDLGDDLPEVADLDALIVLGGTMASIDDQEHPWLARVRDLLASAVEQDVPTLGICLGAQLLALAGGGQVQVAAPSGPERGVIEVRMRPDAAKDPVLGPVMDALGRDIPVPAMHSDAVTVLPKSATWLASSLQYPFQAFRLRSALGLQFHPEASEDIMRQWAVGEGLDADELTAGYAQHGEGLAVLVRELGSAFAAQVRQRVTV
ncbi:type 1 glutamine amidotransferase [Ruania halotolerans]|uniref:type 1 glutamine amidotransferase n=1 Tax=Ruania halotolerans TaxID=2897773 RepID=UPI001E4A62DA|nr:type 1 glutamine amidotransferase [Ruania halotolerans]UFU07247.1 type 1 glutamine amidotransferase [Ruania halotolerans]